MKQKEEKVALDRLVKNKLLIFLVFGLSLSSCRTMEVVHLNGGIVDDTNTELNYSYFFNEGLKNKNFGNVSKAKAFYEKCIELIPTADAPYYELSLIYNYLGDFEGALNNGRKAYLLDKHNSWYALNLAQNYISSNKIDSAIFLYEVIVKDDSNDEYKRNLAMLYEQTGKYKKAIEVINSLESKYGINQDLAMYKNGLFLKLGDVKSAKREIEKLLELEPNNLRYITILAETNANAGFEKEALKYYLLALDLDSSYAIAQISLGSYYLKLNRIDEAFFYIDKAFENAQFDLDVKINFISSYLFNGNSLYKDHLDKFQHLLDILVWQYPKNEKVRALYSDHCITAKNLACALVQLRSIIEFGTNNMILWEQYFSLESYFTHYSEIFKHGEEAINKFPQNTRLIFSYGFAAWQSGKENLAINILENGLNYIDNDSSLLIQYLSVLGEIYYDLERYVKSDYYFENVLKLDADNLLVLNNYSYYLSLQNRELEKALKYSRRTIEIEPNNSTYLDTYAWILYQRKDYKEALVYIEKAILNGGNTSIAILEHYGDILLENDRLKDAISAWRMSIEIGNTSESIHEKVKKYSL